VFLQLTGRGLVGTAIETYRKIASYGFGLFLRIPAVRTKVQREVKEASVRLQAKLAPSGPSITRYLDLPKKGWSQGAVLEELQDLAALDHTRWEDGRVSGAVYHGGDGLSELQTQAFGKFTVPGLRKMEAEIVAIVLKLFNAPLDAAGVTTSGGTESILMACLSARKRAFVENGITEPEM
jgi:sphinganine-1-phosphate aldolase